MQISPRTRNLSFTLVSDDSRVFIDGGGTEKVYDWTIPEDTPPRLGFYHNHVHGSATYSFLSGL